MNMMHMNRLDVLFSWKIHLDFMAQELERLAFNHATTGSSPVTVYVAGLDDYGWLVIGAVWLHGLEALRWV